MIQPFLPSHTTVGRRIRLRGLLRKPLQMRGFLFACASPVHHEIRTKPGSMPEDEGPSVTEPHG